MTQGDTMCQGSPAGPAAKVEGLGGGFCVGGTGSVGGTGAGVEDDDVPDVLSGASGV